MKLIYILIPLLCTSSCTLPIADTPDPIDTLRQENAALQIENTNLREENTRLKTVGDPSAIENAFGPNVTYTEGSYDSCMRDAHAAYISEGTAYCKKSGYSTGDILANKCQLEDNIMTELKSTKSNAQSECKNLYK